MLVKLDRGNGPLHSGASQGSTAEDGGSEFAASGKGRSAARPIVESSVDQTAEVASAGRLAGSEPLGGLQGTLGVPLDLGVRLRGLSEQADDQQADDGEHGSDWIHCDDFR
jgi:hypothetical protein